MKTQFSRDHDNITINVDIIIINHFIFVERTTAMKIEILVTLAPFAIALH